MGRLLRALQTQIRYKIILPYLALTLMVTMAGAAIAVGLVAASWEERLQNQLAQVARNTTDALVRRERNQLDFLRIIAFAPPNPNQNVPAMADVFAAGDPQLAARALDPYYKYGVANINLDFDRMIAFDRRGVTLVDWARLSEDVDQPPLLSHGMDLSQVDFVRKIIAGEMEDGNDKFSNLIYFAPDVQPYFYTAVPVRRGGEVVGGVLIAIKTDRMLKSLEKSSQAVVTTFYDLSGQAISTTLVPRADLGQLAMQPEALQPLLAGQAQSIFSVEINQRGYELAYSPLVIAGTQVGYFSVGLARDFQVQSLSISRNTIIAIAMILALGSVLIGYVVARSITRPLTNLVEAAEAVTAGDLERRSTVNSPDEFGRLAFAFNQMTEHLLTLYRTSRELSASIEVGPVLDVTARTAQSFVPGTEVLALLDLDDRGTLRYRAHSGAAPAVLALEHLRVAPNDPLLRDLAQHRAPRALRPGDEPRLAQLGLSEVAGFASLMLTPLVVQEEPAGMLIFGHRQPGAFDGAAEPSLVAIANMAASVLYNAVLFDRVQDEASQRRAILQSIADGVVVCDRQRNIVLVNRAAEQMLDIRDWGRVRYNFDQMPLQRVDLRQQLFGREADSLEHYQLGDRVLRLSSAPVIADNGQELGEVIVLHDISAEAAVDKAKTGFIETISHELRSPLTVILGYTDLLLRGMIGELSSEQREILDAVRGRAETMNGWLKNVILVASIEANTLNTDIETQDLAVAVENALAPMRAAFSRKGIETRVQLPDDLPPVLADREQLQIILTQLLDNARRYTASGSVTVAATRQHSGVRLDIIDTGPGIPPEEFGRLFTRFHRIEGNNSPERGSGLGLAITRQLVERQGGRVWVQSQVGRGSTFSFSLVAANEHSDAVASPDNAGTTA
ncbi:MAG TPA: ATP-binding protein [Roseiflexaceae bacterium]|nr:ATP-binding protein [Roseiflexaceae bacterium]